MRKERYAALRRMAAPESGATKNERAIAEVLLETADLARELEKKIKELRITVGKGITAGSVIVRRKDGKGAVTLMLPVEEYSALEFCNNSLRLKLTEDEEQLVCEKLS